MPRSKPPRRKRPRHLRSHDRGMVDFFDRLERITDRAEREAVPRHVALGAHVLRAETAAVAAGVLLSAARAAVLPRTRG